MKELAIKSMKLNRDLDRYVEQALEQGRPVKIGWGRAGDERPKNGEFGVLTHLPEGARVLCLGNLGPLVGAANRGGTLTLRGSTGSMVAAFHVKGKTVVEKDVGDKAGFGMLGGEKHNLTGLSYTSSANHKENLNAEGTRVVSCNTTGLSRTLVPLFEHCGSLKVECTMVRRAADPGDSDKGPINAIKPVLKVPSHHGPDVMTVKPEIEINSLAVAVPTTIMHVHCIIADLPKGHGLSTESIIEMWSNTPRVIIMNGADDRIPTTAEVMEMARDIGRKWGDLHEIFVWEDGVKLVGDRLYYFQAIHQESDVIPENVDCIRALMGVEEDWTKSVEKTDSAISTYYST